MCAEKFNSKFAGSSLARTRLEILWLELGSARKFLIITLARTRLDSKCFGSKWLERRKFLLGHITRIAWQIAQPASTAGQTACSRLLAVLSGYTSCYAILFSRLLAVLYFVLPNFRFRLQFRSGDNSNGQYLIENAKIS